MDNFILWADEKYGHESILKVESDRVVLKSGETISIDVFHAEMGKNQKDDAKKQRAELLQKGSLSKDGKMWFNFESASMFIQAFSTLDEDETLPWYDKDKNEVFLTYTEAKMYAKEIRAVLQALYGLSQNKG